MKYLYLILLIDKFLNWLEKAKYFAQLNLLSAYY